MEIVAAPEEHRRTYAGASLHLADEMEPAEMDADSVAPEGETPMELDESPAPQEEAPAEQS
jgi:hypothetical protein